MGSTAYCVIGSNFGDEGKGLTTNWLSSTTSNNIVVRSNGGCQAGHTVALLDGTRHVFRQFGSGTFNGTPTFLSRYFIINPVVFFQEVDQLRPILEQRGMRLSVYADNDATISIPFDSVINQAIEQRRANDRHGSCGFGINEAVERSLQPQLCIKIKDLFEWSTDQLSQRLNYIRDHYVKDRLTKLFGDQSWRDMIDPELFSDDFTNQFVQFLQLFKVAITPTSIDHLRKYDNIIFEHSQGLLLDEHHPWFPHVTRSRTGTINSAIMCKELGISELNAYYVTRGYLTRHGAGPLPHEVDGPIFDTIEDPTNIPNKFQGSLRFAPLNIDLLSHHIKQDCSHEVVKINPHVMMTCVNQLPQQIPYVVDNQVKHGVLKDVLHAITTAVSPKDTFISRCASGTALITKGE